ncbi:MAG: hypothetical protein V1907_02435 [Candidatus Kerfeldbacteria bacterium]
MAKERKLPITMKNPVGWIVIVASTLIGIVLLIGAITGWGLMFS